MSRNHSRARTSSWPDLPPELLVTISTLLESRTDLSHLRASCKKWRSSVPPPPLRLNPYLPYTIPPKVTTIKNPPYLSLDKPFSVVSSTVFLLRNSTSCKPWLVSVEQTTPDKLRLFHPLTRAPVTDLPENFPQNLLYNFSAREISKGFSLRYSEDGVTNVLVRKGCAPNKVIFWESPDLYSRHQLMVLYDDGNLFCSKLPRGKFYDCRCMIYMRHSHTITHSHATKFQDIIRCRGMLLALDRFGRLYGIEFSTLKVNTILANNPTFKGYIGKHMRLLESNDEIFLIFRMKTSVNECQFELYKLDMHFHVWERIENIGDRILFVSFDTCFFVKPEDILPGFRGNCVVFPKNCFPFDQTGECYGDEKLFQGARQYFEVGISYFDGCQGVFKLISSCPGFSDLLWPPPSWTWECSNESQWTGTSSSSGCKTSSLSAFSGAHIVRRNELLLEKLLQNTNSSLQPCRIQSKQISKVSFEGVHIKAEVLPVLKAIWAKHGSPIGHNTVRSEVVLVSALESLAKVIEVLEETTGRTLTDSQAENLSSIMFDLKCMGLKVDWLVPSVEKALELHKSRPLIEFLAALNKEKAEAAEREKMFLAESAKKKKELEAKIMSLSTELPFAEPMVLDDYLGQGLL